MLLLNTLTQTMRLALFLSRARLVSLFPLHYLLLVSLPFVISHSNRRYGGAHSKSAPRPLI